MEGVVAGVVGLVDLARQGLAVDGVHGDHHPLLRILVADQTLIQEGLLLIGLG